MSLQDFTNAYIEAMLWSTLDDNYEFLDMDYNIDSFDSDSVNKIIKDCSKFYKNNKHYFIYNNSKEYGYSNDEMAGHDFFLTRMGHGTGFWDNEYLEHKSLLTEKSKEFKAYDDIFVQDGKIFVE